MTRSSLPIAKLSDISTDIPVRDIQILPKDGDGLFIQPKDFSAAREVIENHHREIFMNHFKFGDPDFAPHTYDPLGRYNCGRCNQDYEVNKCLLVAIKKLNPETGSCGDWEKQCAGDPEIRLLLKSIQAAGYAEIANGKRWGCHVCPFASSAYKIDSRGRNFYCGKGDFRTHGTACCILNGAKATKKDYADLALEDDDDDY